MAKTGTAKTGSKSKKPAASGARQPDPMAARPLASIPRRVLTIATVIGGIFGIIMSQVLSWSILQSFLFTLMFAAIAIAIASAAYRTIKTIKR